MYIIFKLKKKLKIIIYLNIKEKKEKFSTLKEDFQSYHKLGVKLDSIIFLFSFRIEFHSI